MIDNEWLNVVLNVLLEQVLELSTKNVVMHFYNDVRFFFWNKFDIGKKYKWWGFKNLQTMKAYFKKLTNLNRSNSIQEHSGLQTESHAHLHINHNIFSWS